MKSIKSTLTALSFGLLSFMAMSTSADEGDERNVIIEINKTNDQDALVDLNLDGKIEVFNLPELEIGESRDITTESGNTINLTRTEDGMSVTIDGEDVDLPNIGGDMQAHFLKGGVPLHTSTDNEIQVIGDLTKDQITLIKDAFAAAGVEKKVNFTKGQQMKFFSFGDSDNFDIQIDTDSESTSNSWTTGDGQNIKIIKLGKGDGELHFKSKVMIINTEEKQ